MYGNTAPPRDEKQWHAYVRAAIQAIATEFGESTASSWTYRVGTEPDLFPNHWSGTKEQYFAHYDYTVDAVKSVLPRARVGPGNILNPASTMGTTGGVAPRGKWGLDIIDHIATGKNACTGKVGAPMDFFSCTWYARVGVPTANFDQAVAAMRQRMGKYPQFHNVPIMVGEFAVLHDENRKRLYAGDITEWSASFYASLADRVYKLNVQKLYEWNHATSGILHPRGRVIGFLRQMAGNPHLPVITRAATPMECSAIATRHGDDLLILLYNHSPRRAKAPAETISLTIRDRRMQPGATWRLSEWVVDREHASWAYEYQADAKAAGLSPLPAAGLYEGSPSRLYGENGPKVFKENAAKYARLSEVAQTQKDAPVAAARHTITLTRMLPTHSVHLLRLSPPK